MRSIQDLFWPKLSFLAALVFASESAAPLDYPHSPRGDDADIMHGSRISDPYRWLEAMDAEGTLDWARQQNQLTQRYLQRPERDRIQRRIEELNRIEQIGWMMRSGGKTFLRRQLPDQQHAEVLLKLEGSEDRTLLSFPYGFDEASDPRLGVLLPSPDGRYLLVTVSEGRASWRPLRILDVASGEYLDDALNDLHSISPGLNWLNDSSGFYYVRWERDGEGSRAGAVRGRVYLHRLGSGQHDDELIFDSLGKEWLLLPRLSADGRFLVVETKQGAESRTRPFVRDLRGDQSFEPRLVGLSGDHRFLGAAGDTLYFYTDFDAPKGRVIAIGANAAGDADFREIVAETDDAVYASSLVGGNAIGMFSDRIVLTYTRHGVPLVKVFDPDGNYLHAIDMPEGGSIWGGFVGHPDSTRILFRTLSQFRGNEVHEADLARGTQRLVAESQGGLDPDNYLVDNVLYASADGTRVPMFIVRRKDVELDGEAKVFMYGYGAYGWVSLLFYQAHIAHWLERGGVYAQPGIRGGGEYGNEWREAGRAANKTNTVDDFIAAARYLVDKGYTSPGRIVANGGSASGFLPAAAYQRAPDLFGAAILDIPVLDLIRMEHFGNGAFAKPEYGSPTNRKEFDVLRKLSPYHSLVKGACYPPTLVMVGEHDHNAAPAHGYKFVAQAQYAQGCSHPVLLKVMAGAGHGYGGTPAENVVSRTDQVMFALLALTE